MIEYPQLEITPRCINCDNCRQLCPEKSIFKVADRYIIENWSCTMCLICQEVCPVNCIKTANISETKDR